MNLFRIKRALPINTIFFIVLFFPGISKTTIHSADVLRGEMLTVYGRGDLNKDNHVELISSAAHIGFQFAGKSCRVYAYLKSENNHNYLQYELDGIYQKRIKITGNVSQPVIITAKSEGLHTVWIYKATEAHTGPVYIKKITGKTLSAIRKPNSKLIEFIGNSITCGAAADPSEVACGTGAYHDQHNAYYAYGPRVARLLSTNFLVSSVSGIGMYRNWNSDGPAMPAVFEDTEFRPGKNRPWNFRKYTPDIVSIALGTNDFSSGDGRHQRLQFDSVAFVAAYADFVNLVKSKYPEARIALLSSPMVGSERDLLFRRCLDAVKRKVDMSHQEDHPVSLFFFNPMQSHGCSGHPSVEDHAIVAEEIAPFFKSLLNGL